MKDVMIDFETFGTSSDACIIQVGAVFFDKDTGFLGKEYKATVDAESAVQSGAIIDSSTIYWWLQQSEEARKSILNPDKRDIGEVMFELNEFLAPATRIWSHATFDFVILTTTLKRLGIKPRFRYTSGMDLRTLNFLAAPQILNLTRDGVHHDALDDCKFQVKYAVAAMNKIRGKNNE